MRTLLLGMGNPILCDDAVGVRLARDLALRLHQVPDLEVVEECSIGGLDLVDRLRGYQRAIVLDSIETTGGAPGAWYRFDGTALRDTIHLTNVHDANFATALELGRRLGVPLPAPDEIHILAVEVKDNRTFSEQMTPVLEESYPAFSEAIFVEIKQLLAVPGSGSAGSLEVVEEDER
jgi:hydrogenase maturation protease